MFLEYGGEGNIVTIKLTIAVVGTICNLQNINLTA